MRKANFWGNNKNYFGVFANWRNVYQKCVPRKNEKCTKDTFYSVDSGLTRMVHSSTQFLANSIVCQQCQYIRQNDCWRITIPQSILSPQYCNILLGKNIWQTLMDIYYFGLSLSGHFTTSQLKAKINCTFCGGWRNDMKHRKQI